MGYEKLRDVDEPEARELLASARVGHLAYTDRAGEIDGTPVNFRAAGDTIYIRTVEDSAIAQAPSPQPVVFLVTYLERLAQSGWSVKVRGTIRRREDAEAVAEVEPAPWVGSPGTVLMEIDIERITGRRAA